MIKNNEEIKCPYCKAHRSLIIKHGHRKIMVNRSNQRYHCLVCDRRFSLRGDLFRMRNDKPIIEQALLLKQKGNSSREIAKKLDKKVSHVTILRWIKKFI